MPWPFLIVARAKFCCDHIHRFLNLKTIILWQILVKRYPGCLPGRVAHVSTYFGSGSYLTSSNRQRTHSDLVSVTGIRLKCTHRFKIPLSVGDFALVLTCQKGRFSDIHRHRFVDIWCLPCPGPRPTKHISIEFEIRWKFKTLYCKMYITDHNDILHTSRQCHCRDVCKISLWSVEYIRN